MRNEQRADTPSEGIFALVICILASCRSTAESSYSLLNYDRPFLKKIIGDECFGASEGVAADAYRIGLAGMSAASFSRGCGPIPRLTK